MESTTYGGLHVVVFKASIDRTLSNPIPLRNPMTAEIIKFVRPVNGVKVEQRRSDGFINGTAMCVAHKKRISTWLRTRETLELFEALARDLGSPINCSDLNSLDISRLTATKYMEIFPGLIFSKSGHPNSGGGTWLHPDLALQLAQWCNKPFAIQVSRWIREWLTTVQNPVQADLDQEFLAWQQRYDIRVFLKDFLRPELMNAVVRWAEAHGVSPISLCSDVHDAMNERIQGAKAKQIRLMGGLPLGALLRDYFDASPLIGYSAINKLAKNGIEDRGLEPVQAVHEACDYYLGKAYVPELAHVVENLHVQGRRLKAARRQRQLAQGMQMTLPLGM